MKLENVPCDTLSFDPANLRKHGKKNLDAIKASLRRFGQQKPIVVDAKGIVLAGNGTLAAAQELGWKEIQIVRTELAGTQATAFGIADNRSAELAEWDDKLGDVLASLKAEDFPLEDIGFDAADLEELAPEAAGSDVDAEPQIDKAEELRAKWGVELGQVWQLGEHRITCGDSTSAEVVKRLLGEEKPHLMVTDPPYGVEYDPETRKKLGAIKSSVSGKVLNDDRADWKDVWKLFNGDVAYVWHADKKAHIVATTLIDSGFEIRQQIIWHKTGHILSRSHYHFMHEPCWYVVRVGGSSHWNDARDQDSVWKIGKERNGVDKQTEHGTQKPVECMERPIRNNSKPGDLVYEPFSGSGTTIIACERTGRKCRAIELNPAYVAVAIQRWADATGKEPKKL
jgi:DNA modification methylase